VEVFLGRKSNTFVLVTHLLFTEEFGFKVAYRGQVKGAILPE
jgi:hypothetical protein